MRVTLIILIIIVTLLYVAWVEYSVGNILFRTNALGTTSLNIPSLLNLMLNPLHSSFLWTRSTIDLNYPLILLITISGYFMGSNREN
jgi:hypothetical protein